MKTVKVFVWARHPSIETRLRERLRTLSALSLIEKAGPLNNLAPDNDSDSPQPLQVILLTRDPLVEAYLRHQLRTLPDLTCTCVSCQEEHPDAVIIDSQLLTPSEQRVLQACAKYDRLSEVAAESCLTEATVKKHLCHIYTKLGRHSLHRALLCAIRWGLIEVPD